MFCKVVKTDEVHRVFILENTMKFAKKAIAIIGLGLAQLSAQAAPVTIWDYSVTTQWTGSTFTGGTLNATQTPTERSWGADLNGDAAGNGTLAVGVERSGILVEGEVRSGTVVTGSLTPQLTSEFRHINNPISADFATLATATLQTQLVLTPNTPSGSSLPSLTKTFDINFSETPNQAGTCVVEAGSVCDDVFVISLGSLNQSFSYDGFDYFLSIVKMLGPLDPLAPTTCATAGAASPCLGFVTLEGADNLVEFGLIITQVPVDIPEPGVLSLMGLGLLGLVMARRRKV
jgi:hypothetical protein